MHGFKSFLLTLAIIAVPVAVLCVAGGDMFQKGERVIGLNAQHASASPAVKVLPVSLPTVVTDMNAAITSANANGLEAAATLIDLDSNKTYNAGETGTVFRAASTTKVLAAIDYLHEVEQGNATLTQTLDGVSAQQALKQMIEVSDNDAWAAINDYLGSGQQAYATSLGLTTFTIDDNTIAPADEAKLLAQLYQGTLINASHRALLYNYMANTDSTTLIPAALPATATVYNKYGEYTDELHDAAIVSYQNRHFVLVIYTKNDDDPDTTDDVAQAALIHAITTAAFNDVMAAK